MKQKFKGDNKSKPQQRSIDDLTTDKEGGELAPNQGSVKQINAGDGVTPGGESDRRVQIAVTTETPDVQAHGTQSEANRALQDSLVIPSGKKGGMRPGQLTNVRSNASLVSYDQLLGGRRFSPSKHRIGEKDIKVAQLVAANEQLK